MPGTTIPKLPPDIRHELTREIERLVRKRKQLRLTKKELAERIGVWDSAVWRWETMQTTPCVDAWLAWRAALGMPCWPARPTKREARFVFNRAGGKA